MTAGVVFVDLKKAFDSISTLKLLLLLFEIELPPILLLYFCLYFSNRTFQIKLNNFISLLFELLRGCPQGSILAPILFSLFYNGVGSSISSSFYWLFADDLSFYAFNTNIADLIAELKRILQALDIWCSERDLIINFKKTKCLIISKTDIGSTEALPKLLCRGEEIEYVSEFKYLGITFDTSLSFHRHWENVCGRVSSAVGCIMLLKRFINLRVFKSLINSFIMSHIDYGLIIWGSVPDTQINILQSKLNTILGAFFYPQLVNRYQKLSRIAHHYENIKYQKPSLDYLELHEKCNLLTIKERIYYFYAIFAYRSIRLNSIPELTVNFKFGHSQRNQTVIIPSHNTTFFKKSPIFQSILVWNKLSSAAKDPELSLPKFTKVINAWLINLRLTDFVLT